MHTHNDPRPGPSPGSAETRDTTPWVRSEDLLQGGRRLMIEHGGETYHLRITRNEGLVLNKL